ncbi:MAG: hypothetical protein LBQ31_03055 [Bacteroidales bacterium]|nr:hypothetical protein [Bacteroidales bacterium]
MPRKLGKKDFRSIPNASPPQCPTRADYAKRERLHCEAIIPNASPPQCPNATNIVIISCIFSIFTFFGFSGIMSSVFSNRQELFTYLY